MKKITTKKLPNRLLQHGALSAAIAGVADASGQVIYTDVIPDAGGLQIIDVNNDGLLEFVIATFSASSAVRGYPASNSFSANAVGNAILGVPVGPFNYPSNLSFGAPISSAGPWNSAYALHDFCYGAGFVNSQFCGVTDAYIGLRFDILGSYHYGWARLDVTTVLGSTYVLKDFAYEATPGAQIAAGDNGILGLEDNTLNNVKIIALNKSIALYNLTGNTNYNLFSISGQSVLNGTTDNDTYVIEANTVATGVYIMELKDAETSAVIRKKIVL